MEIKLIIGGRYAVSTDSVCRVTYMRAGKERVYVTAYAGQQEFFVAQSSVAYVDDENADVTLFPDAPTAIDWLCGGGNADGLPVGYKRVEYLEVTRGDSQHIPTAILSIWGWRVSWQAWGKDYFNFMGTTDYADDGTTYGEGINAGRSYDRPLMQATVSKQVQFYQEAGWANEKHTYEYDDANWSFYKDGQQIEKVAAYEHGKVKKDIATPLSILGSFSAYRPYIYSTVGLRCAEFKFWNPEGELKGNYVPALDPTGAPCMYDLVTKTPFYNAGTGDFTYPGKETTATTYSLRSPRMYAKKTEHGIRRLYHVPKGYNGTPEEYAAENGFKVLVETEQPEEGYWVPQWKETEDTIELEWVETEPPVNEEIGA